MKIIDEHAVYIFKFEKNKAWSKTKPIIITNLQWGGYGIRTVPGEP
jgi:hypothetical protein